MELHNASGAGKERGAMSSLCVKDFAQCSLESEDQCCSAARCTRLSKWWSACQPIAIAPTAPALVTRAELCENAVPLSYSATAQRLNCRFRQGRPSSRLQDAGVLLHVFEGKCSIASANTMPFSCRGESFLSASIISQSYGSLYTWEQQGRNATSLEGVVLAPSVNISCSWSLDGGTVSRVCGRGAKATTCVAGCGDPPQWCASATKPWRPQWCPWRPTDLKHMLVDHQWLFRQNTGQTSMPGTLAARYHNEVVVPLVNLEHLPVEAIFVTGPVPSRRTMTFWRSLANETAQRRPPPLLHLRLTDRHSPFRLL